jgi:hypothetical protein
MWPAVIVFAALATCAVVVVVGYFRGNRRLQAAHAHPPVTLLRPGVQPAPDEPQPQPQSENWIWR